MDFFKSSTKKSKLEATQNLFQNLNWSSHLQHHGQDGFAISNPLQLGLTATITTMAYDPVQSFLAAGTSDGHCHLWGSPALHLNWQVPPSRPIKFLTFKPGSPLLCVIDSKNDLAVYNLSKLQDGLPSREYIHSVRSTVTCIEVSPAHSHMFLGLQDGTCDCFDMDRGIVSPYRIRNLWLQQENLYRKSGAPRASGARRTPICTDLKFHPFDLNLILVAHEGGISLYDIKQQLIVRTYELIIPPGAIGGNSNPTHPSVFEQRTPNVHCICFRPDGLVFAAGYSDGCLAFWSIDDGELPLLVRTVDRDNVFTFDWPDPQDDPVIDLPQSETLRGREPIFKMVWSHCPSGRHENSVREQADNGLTDGTKLIVLGGLLENDSNGLRIFHLPHYRFKNKAADGFSINSRSSLKDSVTSARISIYLTDEVLDDFILIPRKSPYFDNAEDPVAILISSTCSPRHDWFESGQLSSDDNPLFSGRTVRAYAFPPHIHEPPQEYLLPPSFDWVGSKSVVISQMFDLSDIAYRSLRSMPESKASALNRMSYLPLSGGKLRASPFIMASLEQNFHEASSLITELSQNHRLLVTLHLDHKIRFWDISLHLLLPKKCISSDQVDAQESKNPVNCTAQYDFNLRSEFPRRLDHLTVDMTSILTSPSGDNAELDFSKLALPIDLQLKPESLDLIIILADRSCLVYKFHQQSFTSDEAQIDPSTIPDSNFSRSSYLPTNLTEPVVFLSGPSDCASDSDSLKPSGKFKAQSQKSDALIDLRKHQKTKLSGFMPTALIKEATDSEANGGTVVDQGEVLYALEDIGFLAIAHSNQDWIKIIDLRKFKLVFDDVIQTSKARGKSKDNLVKCISWMIARTQSDSTVLPRLIIGLSSGSFKMVNLIPSDPNSIDNWTAFLTPGDLFKYDDHQESGSFPNSPLAAFVFDPEGRPQLANLASLRNALSQSSRSQTILAEEDSCPSPAMQTSLDSILVVVFSRSVMARMNINGPQLLNKTDLSPEPFIYASIISYYSSRVLLLIDRKSTCHILSLPKLELIFRSTLPVSGRDEHPRTICVDRSGDVLEHVRLSTTQLTTLIYGRDSIYFPETKVYNPSNLAPDPPKANDESLGLSSMTINLASNLVSWFNPNSQSTTVGSRSRASTMTGSGLDGILAGPQRPLGKKFVPQPPQGSRKRPTGFMILSKPMSNSNTQKTSQDPNAGRRASKEKSTSSETDSPTSKALLNQNFEALDERAERLNLLNERFDDLAHSSNQLVAEAKRLAQQQVAKSTFSVGLSNVKSMFK